MGYMCVLFDIVSVVPHQKRIAVELLISRTFCGQKAILYDITEKVPYLTITCHVDEPLQAIQKKSIPNDITM